VCEQVCEELEAAQQGKLMEKEKMKTTWARRLANRTKDLDEKVQAADARAAQAERKLADLKVRGDEDGDTTHSHSSPLLRPRRPVQKAAGCLGLKLTSTRGRRGGGWVGNVRRAVAAGVEGARARQEGEGFECAGGGGGACRRCAITQRPHHHALAHG
jgi:hypothetical protein